MKSKVVIYARFSSHSQTEQSIEGQLRECYEYAKRNDYVVVNEYIDRAISGMTDNRPAFLQMIEDSKKKEFEYVLVYQLDRFARSRYDSANYKAKLKKSGIRVLSARENISDDASGVLMESVLEGMAEYYSKELGQKVKRGINESLIKGNYIGGSVNLGYKIVDKKWAVEPQEARLVEEVFKQYANGKFAKEICDDLNKNGFKNKQGKKFTVEIIAKMLRNRKYIGEFNCKGIVYNDIVPPIISKELFDKCNKIMDQHKHRQKHKNRVDDYILSSKLYCGYCGCTMTAESGNGKNGTKHRYYKCRNRKHLIKECESKTIRKDYIENLIVDVTKNHILTKSRVDQIANLIAKQYNAELGENLELANLQAQLKEIDKQIESLITAIMNGLNSKSIELKIKQLENEKSILTEKMVLSESHQTKPIKPEDIKHFIYYFMSKDYSNHNERVEFFTKFISKIIYYNDRLIIIYNTKSNDSEEIVINSKEDIEKIENTIKDLEEKKSFSVNHAERQVNGGDGEIRTLVQVTQQTHFECVPVRPLRYVSKTHIV